MNKAVLVRLCGALAVALALVASACSAPDDKTTDAGGAVTVNLPTGKSYTFDSVPKRIITLGTTWTDVVLQFGVTPVGYLDDFKASSKEAAPWLPKDFTSTEVELGGDLATAVAKLKPDLIFAPGFAAEQTAQLEGLGVPVIGKIGNAQAALGVDSWRDMTTLVGTILRQPDKAKEIISATDSYISDFAKSLPNIAGKTYTFANYYTADQIVALASSTDGAGELFSKLGLKLSDTIAAQFAKNPNEARIMISTERVPDLNSDVLFILTPTPDLAAKLKKLAGYSRLTSVRTGAVSELTLAQGTALNTPSPSSLRYALDSIKPALEKLNEAASK